ncbi:MAG TPA: shikimate kinase [Firmicutes bacterium]|nr:shikimate kinase [Bacillota bacterium]
MNIVLIGYRGTGKTAVGRVLAERLGWPLVSLDALIVERAGRSIPEIVKAEGWEHFRDLETEVIRECAAKDRHILDAGGGCVLRPENVTALRKNGLLFWLQAAVSTIAERIQDDTQRPSLTGSKSFTEEISDVLRERNEKYRAAADYAVNTDSLSVEAVAQRIIELYRQHEQKT